MAYDFRAIESKWQDIWEKDRAFKTFETPEKPKYYCLEMFPYPSGKLHMGHVRNYSIGDVVARFKRMKGFNVLHPMGWDAFGLPAENAAIKHGIPPARWTWDNIRNMKRQLKELGISYDWNREVASCHPDYYKWTQWLFLQLYKNGLAYKKTAAVNWCPSCATVLANEQVVAGKCERCGATVGKKELSQWFFKITDYAVRLLADLEKLPGWPEKVKTMQYNWIGRSEGVQFSFKAEKTGDEIPVFTTRHDTVYGVTFIVLAPEHPLVTKLVKGTGYEHEVAEFKKKMEGYSEIDRTSEATEKIGLFTGAYAINPMNGDRVPILIANYVLMEYGTGAVMGVPAHDQRDFEFAKKYNLPIRVVIQRPEGEPLDAQSMTGAYVDTGYLVNSGQFNGIENLKAQEKIADYMEQHKIGKRIVNFRLRDWLISRQRYWGAPIPIIYCEKCGIVPVPESNLPVLLPEDVEFNPEGTSPLLQCKDFLNTWCPECGGPAKRETDTMDTFVCSSWYFLRYTSPQSDNAPFVRENVDYWMPVDQYIGGVEHAILHLMYSRFFMKVLHDIGLVRDEEPFTNLLTQGMVLKDGFKMSKSKGNIVSPEDIVEKYGADTARLFILFASPPERDLEWSDAGVEGCYRFLNRIWRLTEDYLGIQTNLRSGEINSEDRAMRRVIHYTIKKVTDDIEQRFNFNTAVSAIMELVNAAARYKEQDPHTAVMKEAVEMIVVLLCAFAPHITEELWHMLGHDESVHSLSWPEYNETYLKLDEVEVVVQVNGKIKDRMMVDTDSDIAGIELKALNLDRIKNAIGNKNIVKVVTVPKKLVNIVVK